MKAIATIVAVAMLAGCATAPRGAGYVPLVDMQGKNPAQFDRDVAECQVYARKTLDAMSGALAGAIAVGLLAAILSPRGYRNDGARTGAIVGGVAGGASANDTQESVIKRCMVGRGWNVLN